MKVMTFEQFASMNGASRQSIGEAALHMSSHHKSHKTHHRQVMAQAKSDHELIIKRGHLREEYERLVSEGVIRPPTALESSVATANGHPDNLATQAARRLLARKGYDWRTGEKCSAKSA